MCLAKAFICSCPIITGPSSLLLYLLFRWIKDQQKSEGVTPGEDVYIILRLDGRVRRSGRVSVGFEQIAFLIMLIFCFAHLNITGGNRFLFYSLGL